MEPKSFKDYIPAQATKEVKKPVAKKVTKVAPPIVVEKKEEKSFVEEVVSADARRAIYENERTSLTESLRQEITETIKAEYDAKLVEATDSIQEQVNNSILEIMKTNETTFLKLAESLVLSTNKLCEKIDNLQTSLNITVPTPIVQFTMPERNMVKKVHRDSKGNITHVTESFQQDDE